MGLYDREYARNRGTDGGSFGAVGGWSANTWLIVVNVAVHVLRMMLSPGGTGAPFRGGDFLYNHGYFSTAKVTWDGGLEFWRFLTFQFLHAPGLMHVGMNMLGLFMFGSLVEGHLGRKKYLAFYLTCGVMGALMFLLLNMIGLTFFKTTPPTPPTGLFRIFLTTDAVAPLVGASAGVFGVIVACAYIAPDTIVQLLFPPISLRMKLFAYGYVALAAGGLFLGGSNQGGDAAHLGGAIAGFFLIRHSHLLRDFFDIFGDSRKPPKGRPWGGVQRPPGSPSSAPSRHLPLLRDEYLEDDVPSDSEVDRVLAKHKESGKESLTPQEIATLRKATQARRAADRS